MNNLQFKRENTELREWVSNLLKKKTGIKHGFLLDTIKGDGSNREFYRIRHGKRSFILMINHPVNTLLERENISYLKIGKHLREKGLPIPEIMDFELKNGWFILEDLGDIHLQDIPPSKRRDSLYEKVIELLLSMQLKGAEGFKEEWCYQTKLYNRYMMLKYEAEYFLNEFVINFAHLNPEKESLLKAFNYISEMAGIGDNRFFMHRDFQSKNIMLKGGKRPFIIDWQGGRFGPLGYDLASLIIDPYVNLSESEKNRSYDIYLEFMKIRCPQFISGFKRSYPYLAIQRNMQILGAFSYLGLKKGKREFLKYISPAVESLKQLIEEINDPELIPINSTVIQAQEIISRCSCQNQ